MMILISAIYRISFRMRILRTKDRIGWNGNQVVIQPIGLFLAAGKREKCDNKAIRWLNA
jgi:hypothetical protein